MSEREEGGVRERVGEREEGEARERVSEMEEGGVRQKVSERKEGGARERARVWARGREAWGEKRAEQSHMKSDLIQDGQNMKFTTHNDYHW